IDPARKKEMLNYKNGPKVEIINLAQFQKKANLSALGNLKQEFMTALPSKSKKMSIHTDQTYLGFSIATDSIKVIKANGHTMYVFPVELPSKRAVAFQNLTIDEGPDGTIAFVNTYTPTKKWIAEWRKGHSGKFEGDISITYLNLNNGTAPKTTKAPTKSGIKNPNTSLVAQICTSIDYFYEIPYACGSGQHAPWDTGCYLEGDARAGYVYIEYRVTTCVDDPNPGGGSGGTTPTPPGDYNPCPDDPPMVSSKKTLRNKVMVLPPTDCDEVVDCAGVMGGSAYVNPNCGTCMGGTTGITACPPEIINNVEDTCLKKTVAAVLNNDVKGKISEIIANLDKNLSVKVKIFDAETISGGADGNNTNSQ
ncbi:hypothetical protein, partial [Pedobacter insulae]